MGFTYVSVGWLCSQVSWAGAGSNGCPFVHVVTLANRRPTKNKTGVGRDVGCMAQQLSHRPSKY